MLFPSGRDGLGRVLECESGVRFLVEAAEPVQRPVRDEVEPTREGTALTRIVLTERGAPSAMIAADGVGTQLHLENLRAHLAGRPRVDPEPYWAELLPQYERLAAALETTTRG